MRFDTTIDQLRECGSLKWTMYPDAIGMWIAEMDFGMPDVVADTIEHSVTSGALGYATEADHRNLKETTAAFQKNRFGWEIDPDNIAVFPDVLTGLRQMIRHLTKADSSVIIPTPAYMPFLTLPGEEGREVIQVPATRDSDGRLTKDLKAVDAAFAKGGRLLVLCNPCNPGGRVYTRDELTALTSIVDYYGGRVFSDEIHSPLVLEGEHIPYASTSPAAAAHTVTAVSASKGWNMPGLKCAQIIFNDRDREAFAPHLNAVTSTVGSLGIRATTAVYNDDGGWLDTVTDHLRGNRDLFEERIGQMPGISAEHIEGTYIGWIDARELAKRLRVESGAYPEATRPVAADIIRERAGVALTGGASCGKGFEDYARMVLATPRPILAQALDQIEELARS